MTGEMEEEGKEEERTKHGAKKRHKQRGMQRRRRRRNKRDRKNKEEEQRNGWDRSGGEKGEGHGVSLLCCVELTEVKTKETEQYLKQRH